jgi:rare lipoprotein A
MKRLSAVLMLGFVISSFCVAQTQTGNASYNPSKPGLAISHPSLSFNTRVLVTNLLNGRSVEAVVNGRIPIETGRIADVSREVGDSLGMGKTGMTLVEIAVVPVRGAAEPAPVAPPAGPEPQAAGTAAQAPPPPAREPTAPSSPSQGTAPPPPPPAQILPVQTITDIQYVPVPGPAGSNCCSPLLWIVLVLLLLVIILLAAILILILRRLLLWPWHYQVWCRRHLLFTKRRRT